jgi:hypothetical protein
VSKYTPGPWHQGKGQAASIIYGADGWAIANCVVYHRHAKATAEDTAAYIVRAVNAHEAMVQALEMVRDADNDCKRDGAPTIPPIARACIDAALDLVKVAK